MAALATLGTTIAGFFIVGFVLMLFGKITGNDDTVREGRQEVGKGCLFIVGIIVVALILIAIISNS